MACNLQYASSENKLCNSMTVGTDQKTLQGGPASHMLFLTCPEQMATERSTLVAPISYTNLALIAINNTVSYKWHIL